MGNDGMNDSGACSDSENYGFNLGEISESECDQYKLGEDLEEEDLGPEFDGGRNPKS